MEMKMDSANSCGNSRLKTISNNGQPTNQQGWKTMRTKNEKILQLNHQFRKVDQK